MASAPNSGHLEARAFVAGDLREPRRAGAELDAMARIGSWTALYAKSWAGWDARSRDFGWGTEAGLRVQW